MRISLPLVSLLVLSACSKSPAQDEKKQDPVAQISTAIATPETTAGTIAVYGVAEAGPGGERTIVAPAEAIVTAINAPTGTSVGTGQAVITLRPSPSTRALIAKAASDSAVASAAYRRALRMKADGLMSNADVETARAAVANASATRTSLGLVGGQAVLRSPSAGTVQGLTAKPGDQVTAGVALATIGARGDLRGHFGVDPGLAQRVHAGQPVHIEMMDGSSAGTAVVTGVDPQIDASTRLASVYVRMPSNGSYAAGQPLRGALLVGSSSTGVSIPYSALMDDGGRSYVFVVKDGVAKSRDVMPGNSSGATTQILKGLSPGERVVTQGVTALEDGMKVAERHLGAAK